MNRFKGKPLQGLPGALPEGENLLWQSAPDWRALARHAFRVRIVAVYFAALIFWRIGGALMAGHTLRYAALSGLSSILLGAAAIGIFCGFAWMISRSTTYTITSRRLVITYGTALPKSINLPFSRIEAANLAINADGTGDIALKLPAGTRLSYLLLWPHVRTDQGRTEPVLRCLAQPDDAVRVLTTALSATLPATERLVTAAAAAAAEPAELMQARAA